MCCDNNPDLVREILKNFDPEDYLIGYKVLEFHRGGENGRIVTPFYGHVLSMQTLVSGELVSDSRNRTGCLIFKEINNGIHVYKRRGTAENVATCYGGRGVVKAFGMVKDLIGVDNATAVFKKVILDKDDLLQILKRKKM